MDQLKITKIFITKDHLSEIIAIAKRCAPNEACGIIAGEGSTIKKIYEISNSLQSPVEYLMDAAEMVEVFWEIEKKSWDTVAFFHSGGPGALELYYEGPGMSKRTIPRSALCTD